MIVPVVGSLDQHGQNVRLQLVYHVAKCFSEGTTYIDGALARKFNAKGMRIGIIHSETILEAIILLHLLVELSEDGIFTRVIAFACIFESHGSTSLN